jgi:hypothetical protein
VSKTPGREFDSGSQTQLGVTRKLGMGFAVVEEVVYWNRSFESGKQVLGSNTVT